MLRTFIIAEAGVNHNGDIVLARKLIDVAAAAKVDAVKFQMFKAEKLLSKDAPKADYQIKTTADSESQYEMIKRLELSKQDHVELMSYCEEKEIMFMSSPFDVQSVDYLNEMGMIIFKIPSGEITNLPLLRRVSKLNKEVFLSSGMSDLQEISEALRILTEGGTNKDNITLLHCNTEYPTPVEDVNLLAMESIRREFEVKVGYSDHTLGIEVPVAAVAMGASVIEKHFTLDKSMEGPDHMASLESHELTEMVIAIRNIEQALGDGVKKPSPSELKNKAIARKSIVAAKQINAGEKFTEDNIYSKRPGTGISPMKWDEVIGQIAKKKFQEDEQIEL